MPLPGSSDGDTCALCGEPLKGQTWIGINRMVACTETSLAFVSYGSDDTEDYVWDKDSMMASGRALHWPVCAGQWIEAQMAESDVEVRRDED